LNLPAFSDADKPAAENSSSGLKLFVGADYIDLSLLNTDKKEEGFGLTYAWEPGTDDDGQLYEKGWHFFAQTYPPGVLPAIFTAIAKKQSPPGGPAAGALPAKQKQPLGRARD
jgi:hypothetical protein